MSVCLPERPNPFPSFVSFDPDDFPTGALKAEAPEEDDQYFIGEVEWSWGPGRDRSDAFYLEETETHFVLWNNWFDDNYGVMQWSPAACVPCSDMRIEVAAVHLLADLWRHERQASGLEHFHSVTSDGALSGDELDAVADLVWP